METAAEAETIVAFVGLPLAYEQEANDRDTLALPGDQVELLNRLADVRDRTGARLVVVLSHGSAVTMDPWHDRVDAILDTWLGGQALGGALADVLFGRVNPSGKIAESFPLALADTPGQPTGAVNAGSSSTARASSSVIAGTTRSGRACATPSATVCPTRGSPIRISRLRSRTPWRPVYASP